MPESPLPAHKRVLAELEEQECDDTREPKRREVECAGPQPARILRAPHSEEVFRRLGSNLQEGKLVAFPTETVYGLGANGLDVKAVLQIFEAKGRPLNDPCILHVDSAAAGSKLLELDDLERSVYGVLTDAFWPGPLSIVGRAKPCVPREVTASTDFVAVRCPAHREARMLLEAAGVPVAAPSANRFGHISPTLAEHVLEDLGHWDGLQILDGGPCGVGIESSVVKLDLPRRVVVLRKGGVTKDRLENALREAKAQGLLSDEVAVEYPEPKLQTDKHPVNDESEAQISPGMLLKHYAPAISTALLSLNLLPGGGKTLPPRPQQTVLIDFGGLMKQHHHLFLKTFDLCGEEVDSSMGVSFEAACKRVFAVLRDAEAFALAEKASFISIVDFSKDGMAGHGEALHDRIYRAASGRRVGLCLEGEEAHFAEL